MESQKRFPNQYSIEFFPPKTDAGKEKLINVVNDLKKLGPAYVSVTFGAGGSTQDGTIETIAMMKELGLDAAPHLSCIGSSRDSLQAIINQYKDMGVSRIVALRGDMPSGMRETGEFHHANELVSFIREVSGDHFHIEVAAYPEFHPQSRNADDDLKNFKRKVDAGANAAITQYFYVVDAYKRFIDDCERLGIDIPVVPGIMPITNYSQLSRFSGMCGAEIPRWLRWRLESYGDDTDAIKQYGMEVTIELCQRLLDAGAPGLHFYSMNQSGPTTQIWEALGL